MEPLVKGHKLENRYTLVKLLHTSEHSQVWLADDGTLRARVALKVALSKTQVDRELLRNEYAMSAQCVHPAVIRVFDLHDTEQHTLLSMEYLTGGRLGDLIGRPPAQFLPAVIELAEAMGHVHKQGLVHRDFKLSNGMLDSRGHARLIDFGVASVKGSAGLRSGGSPRSMSPQQRAGDEPSAADDLYAFGVALYRLTEGNWPGETAPPRRGSGQLAALIDQLLEHDPVRRPPSMDDVAVALRASLAEQSNVTLPPDEFELDTRVSGGTIDDDFDNIEVVSAELPEPPKADSGKDRSRGRALGLLAVYGLIGAALLFYFIPKLASDREVTVAGINTEVGAQSESGGEESDPTDDATDTPSVEPWKLAQEAKLRKEAEAVLEGLLEQQFFLEDERTNVWAADEFEQLKALAIEGDQAFRKNDFEGALELYTKGKALADDLAERSKTILEETLSSAAAKLASANSAEATQFYQLALDIEPTSSTAQRGLERAGNLDQVLTLVAEGEALEQSGEVRSARDAFKRAADLDSQWQPALAGVSRMQKRLASAAYSRHMSDGFAAMERGRFAAAQEAFEKAGRLKPGASEVTAALAQLDTAIRLKDVNRLQSRAQELERQGDLRGAEQQYQAILDQQPSSDTASAMRRVREHAEVDELLTELLAQPSRLANDSVFSSAQNVLERVDPYMSDPRISERATQLREFMQAARIPLPVELRSDGQTDILVYRVGRLGTLTNETLNLRPGEYTALGTRQGYRDVRVKFEITPGQQVSPIEVVCRERI
ncbi:MAG: protein kinase [Gammaproteobacteria bacterium]